MDKQPADVHAVGAVTIDEELASVAAAIELVASGSAKRVTLAGLQFGDALVPEARRRAANRHVRIRPLWPMGDGPVGLVVEIAEPGEEVGRSEATDPHA